MTLFNLLADAAPAARQQNMWQMLIMIGVLVFFFYFILFRPEQKRRKALEAVRNGMKKGDKVVAMGIVGTIQRVEKDTVIVRMVDGAKIEFLKAAITEVTPGTGEETTVEEKN